MLTSSYGVPQDSIPSSLLFLIYINDINEAIPGEKIKLFTDDTNLFVQGPDIRNVSDHANLMLAKLHIWFIANKLTLSLDKSCFTIFSKSTTDSCVIKVTDSKLLQVDHCKYLGLYCDKNMNWSAHIDYVYNKLLKYVGIFYKLQYKVLSNVSVIFTMHLFIHTLWYSTVC